MKKIRNKQQDGFTLLELAVVMIIMGLLIGGSIPLYRLYIKEQQAQTTRQNLADVKSTLENFRKRNGYYPCPASITAKTTDANYGQEIKNCNTLTIAPGTCSGGLCAENGVVQVTDINGVLYTPYILRGMVPFYALGIPGKKAYDGYKGRIAYAVTTKLTDPNTFDETEGGIRIIGGAGNILTTTISGEGSAHYVLISSGEDQVGAYSNEGVLVQPCSSTNLEAQNCDQTTQAVYRVSTQNAAGNNLQFDDVVKYGAVPKPSLWRQVPGTNNIVNYALKNVGIGIVPTGGELLSVSSDVLAQTAIAASANHDVCEQGGQYCFDASYIALGESCATKMSNPLAVMTGFANGKITCSIPTAACPAGQRATGFDANGFPLCATISVVNQPCPAQSAVICGQTKTLPAGAPGATKNLNVNSRYETYTCTNGAWVQTNASGSCSCTPGTTSWSSSAYCTNLGMTGTQTVQVVTTCSPYSKVNTVIQACTPGTPCIAANPTLCAGTSAAKTVSLPAAPAGTQQYFGGIGVSYTAKYLCAGGVWSLSSSSGLCVATSGCSSTNVSICGANKTLPTAVVSTNVVVSAPTPSTQKDQYQCDPSGNWTLINSAGVCAGFAPCSAMNDPICVGKFNNLPSASHGTTFSGQYGSAYLCKNGVWTMTSSPSCPSGVSCKWQKTGGKGGSGTFQGTSVGSGCAQSQAGQSPSTNSGLCSVPSGSQYNYYPCQCQCVSWP